MSNLPERMEWRTSSGGLSYVLLVDEFGFVTDSERAPSPLVRGTAKVSYAAFLSGRRHSLIRSTFGEAVLNEALQLVARNARILASDSPAA